MGGRDYPQNPEPNTQQLQIDAAGDRFELADPYLQVGDLAPAEAFYSDLLGFPITCRYPGASFYGSGGYHHQLATNVWNSRGAPARSDEATGLADVEIIAEEAVMDAVRSRLPPAAAHADDPSHLPLRDPWGTSVTLVRS